MSVPVPNPRRLNFLLKGILLLGVAAGMSSQLIALEMRLHYYLSFPRNDRPEFPAWLVAQATLSLPLYPLLGWVLWIHRGEGISARENYRLLRSSLSFLRTPASLSPSARKGVERRKRGILLLALYLLIAFTFDRAFDHRFYRRLHADPAKAPPITQTPHGLEMRVTLSRKDLDPSSVKHVLTQGKMIPGFDAGKPRGYQVFMLPSDAVLLKLGVESGDVILSVEGVPLTDRASLSHLSQLLSHLQSGKPGTLLLSRQGKEIVVRLEVRD